MFKKILVLVNQNKILVFILLVAASLRFVGTNPGYNQYHSDQGISYSAATSMIKNGNLDPLRYDYPALVPDINYIFFRLIFIPLNWTKYYISHIPEILDGIVHIPIAPLEEKKLFQTYVLGEREINAIFWSRYVTALFGIGTVFLTYVMAKQIFKKLGENTGNIIGLIAALLLTFNYKHVTNSHFGLPDIYNSFFLLASLLATINLWRSPNRNSYLLAGLAAGLSFSVKYQVFALLPLGLVHLYLSIDKDRLNLKKLFNPWMIAAVLLVPIVFAATNPYFFIHINKALKSISDVSQKYGMGTNKLNLYPLWYMQNIDYGLTQMIAMLLGAIFILRKLFKESLIFFSILAPFAFIFLYYSNGGFYIRNFITTTPLLMILAAYAFWLLYSFVKNKSSHTLALIVLMLTLIGAIVVPAKNSIINSYYYTKPWGYDVLREWMQTGIPKDAVVAAHPFDFSKGLISNKRTEFEISGSYSLAEHKENGADYALMNLDWAGNSFYAWMGGGLETLQIGKPLQRMRNTFHGIAAEELFHYQVFSTSKPWQAPDSGLVVAKIPVWPNVEMTEIKRFIFGNQDGWLIFGGDKDAEPEYEFDNSLGKEEVGSLIFKQKGWKYPGTRITSEPMKIKSGYLYKITGFLKTEKILAPRDREGFIRVDFYGENPDLEQRGVFTSISSRVYGTTDWVEKEVIARVPDNAKYLTVSFGLYQPNKTTIWLDDVKISQSSTFVEDLTTKPPYLNKDIDLNLLYPNSHGNL